MGQRGPVKRSSGFQVLGGGRSSTSNQETVKARAKRPAVPSWLPPEAKKFLRKIIPELEAFLADEGGLKEGDGAGLAAMALHYAILAAACKEITDGEGKDAKLKLTTGDPDHPSDDGEAAIRKHPLLSVVATNSEKLKAWVEAYAYTPAARKRLDIKPPKGANKLEKFLAGKKY